MSQGQRIGRYELLGELARGGMGAVYRARDLELGREVAIKVITTPLGPEALGRFKLEGEAAARVSHPNVLQVHERGVHQGRPYLVMDLAAGSLRDRLRKGGPLPGPEAALLLAPIADALGQVHAAQILHRDLKPENILLSSDGTPLLADFGIARAVDRETRYTQSGVLVGTPAYMAPEQASAEEFDTRVDVYGLGAILYELVTGRPPFIGGTVVNVLNRVMNEPPMAPSQISPGLEKWVEALILRCLEKSPQDRWPNMEELARALRSGKVPGQVRSSSALLGGLLIGVGLVGLSLALAWGYSAATGETPTPSATRARETLSLRPLGPVSPEGVLEVELSLSPPGARRRRVEQRSGGETRFVEIDPSRATRLRLRCEELGTTTWTFALVGGRATAEIRAECPELPTWYLRLSPRPPLLPGLVPDTEAGDYLNKVDRSLMRWIPPGEALMSNAEYQGSARVTRGFYLGKFEVTQAQYQAYLRWRGLRAGKERPGFPMQVDFHGATRYSRWAGGRLPTILEWNLAAFGPFGSQRTFPWGEAKPNSKDHDIGTGKSGPSPVLRPRDRTPEGVIGMGGGVVEWVADVNPLGPLAALEADHSTPSAPARKREPRDPILGRLREVRGSSFGHDLLSAHARWHPSRAAYLLGRPFVDQGFRLVRSPLRLEPEHLEWKVRFRRFESSATLVRDGGRGPTEFGPFLEQGVTTKLLRNPWQRVIPAPARDSFATFARSEFELPAGSWVFSILHADDGVRLRVRDGERVLAEVDEWQHQVARHLEVVVKLEEATPVVVEVEHCELQGGEGLWVELSRE